MRRICSKARGPHSPAHTGAHTHATSGGGTESGRHCERRRRIWLHWHRHHRRLRLTLDPALDQGLSGNKRPIQQLPLCMMHTCGLSATPQPCSAPTGGSSTCSLSAEGGLTVQHELLSTLLQCASRRCMSQTLKHLACTAQPGHWLSVVDCPCVLDLFIWQKGPVNDNANQ